MLSTLNTIHHMETAGPDNFRDSFRSYYHTFQTALHACATRSNAESPLEPEELAELGNQLDEFIRLLNQVSFIRLDLDSSYLKSFSIPMYLSKRSWI